jgi:hydroxymethylglutaryl-CoA reductase (NADPH)
VIVFLLKSIQFIENYLLYPLEVTSKLFLVHRSSRFGKLQGINCALAGRNVYIRFTCSTGDAMGMNMVSKGVENVLGYLQTDFPDMDIISLSGLVLPFCSVIAKKN